MPIPPAFPLLNPGMYRTSLAEEVARARNWAGTALLSLCSATLTEWLLHHLSTARVWPPARVLVVHAAVVKTLLLRDRVVGSTTSVRTSAAYPRAPLGYASD
jgi:hypothetical protein